jgi:hypothetical protein
MIAITDKYSSFLGTGTHCVTHPAAAHRPQGEHRAHAVGIELTAGAFSAHAEYRL